MGKLNQIQNTFLKHLEIVSQIPSVSGNEGEVRNFLLSTIKKTSVRIIIDKKGNLIVQKGKNPEKLTLVAHMDKEGFMVSNISNRFLNVVGIRKYPVFQKGFSASVIMQNNKGEKEISVLKNYGSKQNDLKVTVRNHEKFSVGDYVAYYYPLKNNLDSISSSHLDNSVGVVIALQVLDSIKNGTVVFSAQEAIGFHGIGAAMYRIKPEKVIVLDATYASDKKVSGAKLYLGKGPSICIKDKVLGDKNIINELRTIAQKYTIPFQIEIWEEANSDLLGIYPLFDGIPSCFVGIPVKNHSSTKETGSLQDMYNAYNLLIQYFSYVYES